MPSPTSLNRDRIVQAALALIDQAGIEKLTMRGLGQHLGVDPMAIYHYLPNKEAVLDAIVEELWSGVAPPAPRPASAAGDWPAQLHALFRAMRAHLLTHPRAVLLLGTRPATTPALLSLIDQTLGRMTAAGLPAHEAMPLLDCLTAFTVGKVLGEVSQQSQRDKVLQAIQSVTAQHHPHLFEALAGGYGPAPDDQFDHGLRALIHGWASARQLA